MVLLFIQFYLNGKKNVRNKFFGQNIKFILCTMINKYKINIKMIFSVNVFISG